MLKVEQRDRSQLVRLVRTVLRVRNCLGEREVQEGVDTMLEMASTILKSNNYNEMRIEGLGGRCGLAAVKGGLGNPWVSDKDSG